MTAPDPEPSELLDDPETWLIFYDDTDRPIEMFSGSGATRAAMRRFDQSQTSWNCHLFRRVASNRDELKALTAPTPSQTTGEWVLMQRELIAVAFMVRHSTLSGDPQTEIYVRRENADSVAKLFNGTVEPLYTAAPTSPPQPAQTGWRCFHCNEVFADWGHARNHFGWTPDDGAPACRVDGGLASQVYHLRRQVEALKAQPAQAMGETVTIPSDEYEVLRQIQFYARQDQREMVVRYCLQLREIDTRKSNPPATSRELR